MKFDIGQYDINFSKLKKFKPNIVIHLAWSGIPDFSYKISRENFKNSVNFLSNIIQIESCKKIIITGSSYEALLKNKQNYKMMKRIKHFVHFKNLLKNWALSKCNSKNISFAWLRIFYVYGPYQRKNSLISILYENLKKKKNPDIKHPLSYNDFIFVDDVTKIIKKAIKFKFKSGVYDIGRGKLVSVWSIAQIVEKILNKKNLIFNNINKKKLKNKIVINPIAKFKKNEFNTKIKFTKLKIGIFKTIKNYKKNDNNKNSI